MNDWADFPKVGNAMTKTMSSLLLSLFVSVAIAPAPAAAEQSQAPLEVGLGAGMDAAVREAANDPRFKGQSEQQRRDIIEFVAGNVIFAVVHEVGHMLISELALPVLGREEDAADAFAVITGLKLGNAFSDRVLTESARGWFMSEARNKKDKIKTVYYDEHGLDEQRAYNIVCLMVGSSPQRFSALADKTKLPDERQGTCQGDYSNASWSWEKVLTRPQRRSGESPGRCGVCRQQGIRVPEAQLCSPAAAGNPRGASLGSIRLARAGELRDDGLRRAGRALGPVAAQDRRLLRARGRLRQPLPRLC